MKTVRKILLWTLVAFFIYSVFTSPSQAASMVQSAWDVILLGFKNIASFFNKILSRN